MTVGHGHAAAVRISGRPSVTHERQSAEGINVDLLLVSGILVEVEEQQETIGHRHSQRTHVAAETAEVERRALQGSCRDSRPHLLADR